MSFGSNVCNLFLILGLSTIIRPICFQRETRLIELPMCLVFTAIFMILSNVGGGISRVDAIILIALFMLFILYTIIMGRKGEKFDKIESSKEKEDISIFKNIIYILLGIIRIKARWGFYG